MIKWFKELFKDIFYEEYVILVWFAKKSVNKDGIEVLYYRDSPKQLRLSHVKKITQTEIIGNDLDGNPVHVKSLLPFNYNLIKKH